MPYAICTIRGTTSCNRRKSMLGTGESGNQVKRYIPWDGQIPATRKSWPKLQAQIKEAGLAWEGDDPDAPLTSSIVMRRENVPGWISPAPNGHLLHQYQKEGIEFCGSRGMRALIADEMGVGKTAQALGAALAVEAKSILIVCPANARYVWEREILGWAGGGGQSIQHITTSITALNPGVRWRIVTYDLLIARPVSWTLDDKNERALIETGVDPVTTRGKHTYPLDVTLRKYTNHVPQFTNAEKVAKWMIAMRRLGNELLRNLQAAGHDLLIVDEAHRAKNTDAKRSQSVMELAGRIPQVLLLTGTPMRNHPSEAGVLLSYIDAEAGDVFAKERGYATDDIRDYLHYLMIRRLKRDVLPQLPDKIRQTIELDALDPEQMSLYEEAMGGAYRLYAEALGEGCSDREAWTAARPMVERARNHLGLAKVCGGQVTQLICDIVNQKGNVVVFCSHHACSDTLKQQLADIGIRAEIVDGRTKAEDRKRVEEEFQAGRLPCFVGGINAAGEAITLTATDTVVFVELDWVPAALLQAEDRIHRVGQSRGCHIIHLLAHGDTLDNEMAHRLFAKLETINRVLEEDAKVLADEKPKQIGTYGEMLQRLCSQDHSDASRGSRSPLRP